MRSRQQPKQQFFCIRPHQDNGNCCLGSPFIAERRQKNAKTFQSKKHETGGWQEYHCSQQRPKEFGYALEFGLATATWKTCPERCDEYRGNLHGVWRQKRGHTEHPKKKHTLSNWSKQSKGTSAALAYFFLCVCVCQLFGWAHLEDSMNNCHLGAGCC